MTEKLSDISENAKRLKAQVAEAAIKSGRSEKDVRLMAVTKMNSAERVNDAIAAGITLLGENRAQELLDKYDRYDRDNCDIHFIGHLQSNKVKKIVDKVSMIESLDSISLAKEIDRCSKEIGIVMPVLVEVNIGAEENKSGVLPTYLDDFIAEAASFSGISVRGLMAIPPNIDDNYKKEIYFEQMYRHFIDIKAKKMDNVSMEILSMGMSYDFILAIAHGSTVVRLGRALFGERKPL